MDAISIGMMQRRIAKISDIADKNQQSMLNFNEQDKGYKDCLQLAREGKKKHDFNSNQLEETQAERRQHHDK